MSYAIEYGRAAFFKLHTGKDYYELGFDEPYFLTLLDHMGSSPDQIDIAAFVQAHMELATSYFEAKQVEDRWPSVDAENMALARVQKMAKELSDALHGLESNGQAGQRLHAELAANEQVAFDQAGVTLADLLGDPGHRPFEGVTDLLYDLQIGLERTKIRKPRAHTAPAIGDNPKAWDKKQAAHVMTVMAAHSHQDDQADRYRSQVEDHALPANFAVHAFAEGFEGFWGTFSPLAFTEGRYEPDARQRISRTVDAADHCLKAYGETCPRSLAERAIQKVRIESKDIRL